MRTEPLSGYERLKVLHDVFNMDTNEPFRFSFDMVRTEPLSGYERLKVLHDVFNMDTNEPFRFSFDMVARTGLSTKDFIAPTSFDFRLLPSISAKASASRWARPSAQ
ncbi:putative TraE protein [Candidatus Colimorpha enterica]|uniref:Putative TraE protein n=1 Tax=Candidatus Colimorpha enterica TaxID=3083063 RepID=R6TWQ9_9BACT|nr:putative TraE protein [Candidatus Colimorpha enterica]